jgi:hypothetical protein
MITPLREPFLPHNGCQAARSFLPVRLISRSYLIGFGACPTLPAQQCLACTWSGWLQMIAQALCQFDIELMTAFYADHMCF